MILTEAIKQFKFESSLNKAILNLIYTASQIEVEQRRFFKPFDISPQQYNVLRILRGQYPNAVTLGVIQERMLDQNSNASRLVEKLKLKLLVERNSCIDDRRQVDIKITEKGLELLEAIGKNFKEMENKFSGLNQNEFEQLNILLDKFNSTQQ